MAQKIQTLLTAALDGSEAEGTARFRLDGTEYEIDLNAGHNAGARVQLAWILGLSERRVLEPVGEQLLLAENVDGGVGGRQSAGQDEQLPCCGTADGDVGFAVAAGDRDAGRCPRDQPLTGTG